MASGSLQGTKMWLEVSDKEQDWKEFLLLCAKTHENAEFAKRYLPDVEKRKLFLPHYFNYQYETKYNEGRAVLGFVKAIVPGSNKPVIILGMVTVLNAMSTRKGDTSKMLRVYPTGTETVLERDDWLRREIFIPMSKVASSLNTVVWYGALQVVAEEYQKTGVAKQYFTELYLATRREGIRRMTVERGVESMKNINPSAYSIVIASNPRMRKFLISYGKEIAHLHYDFKSGLKCMDDLTATKEGEMSCVYVVVYTHLDVEVICEEFNKLQTQEKLQTARANM